MKRRVICLAALFLLAPTAQAVSIETVVIGNPGNANDDTGYGTVAYVYNMGKYEVTAGQYTGFLNVTARVDVHGLYNP